MPTVDGTKLAARVEENIKPAPISHIPGLGAARSLRVDLVDVVLINCR